MRCRRHHLVVMFALLSGVLPGGACTEGNECPSTTELQGTLDATAAGSVVRLGACVVAGPIRVPAGVHLQGVSQTQTAIAGSGETSAVTMLAGTAPTQQTQLSQLTVDSSGCAALVARGAGVFGLHDLTVNASRGVGLAVEGASTLTAERVQLVGPVTSVRAAETSPGLPPFRCGSSPLATHGVVLVDVQDAMMTEVTANGFTAFGILAINTVSRWIRGGATTNVGTGFEVWGGRATVDSMVVQDTTDGSGAVESFGAVFGGGAQATTANLRVESGDTFGLFHDDATVTHTDLISQNNGFAGVWAQNSDGLSLMGRAVIQGNAFAGVAALNSTNIQLVGATIDGTVEAVRIDGIRTVRAGDGVHIVDSTGRLENLNLTGNLRVGILADLGGQSSDRVSILNTRVEGSGTALGAVAQNGMVRPGWDTEVTRQGTTAANDALFVGALEIAGAVGPVCFPPLDQLPATGIGALLAP